MLAAAQFNFSPSGLQGETLTNPTSLQFGPDNRLYVAEQGGLIKAFTIARSGANNYRVTATEVIDFINQIPNHDDNGVVNPTVTTRQVTGILVKGTAAVPVLYVSSSDSRIGGPSGKTALDTNSGIVSQLTRSGSTWTKVDLVRGLPRSEENHSVNGMQLDAVTNTLYLAVGGHTNAGSPSNNFNFACEYALSAAILSINLTAINTLATKGSGNTAYKYDLPTLDDPTRPNNADGSDPNDPFGGNMGLNQAKIVAGGPVQVYSPGYRNPYDLVITQARKMYTIDNGANQGWGGYPANEGTANATNNYVPGEPGSTSPTPTEGMVNNLDNLHYIGSLDAYVAGSYYGGHPAPTRANPTNAGLYTFSGSGGVFRTSKTGTDPLPADWPPVAKANSIEGDYQMPGTAKSSARLTFTTSTNGTVEYTASNFNGVLKGSLLACGYDGDIVKIGLTADGTNVTNQLDPATKRNQDLPFASGFGATPLDVIAQGDNDVFPGTVWAATYGGNSITVFEPQDFVVCSGKYDTNDDDQDGYTNADEIDNATQPCSAASVPPDADHDRISDLNDDDDDNDGLADTSDFFGLDATNGLGTTLPVKYNLFNNSPGTGLYGLGFTGLMVNRDSVYSDLYFDSNLIAGGTAGALTVVEVTPGDALGTLNTQENAFQFGVKASAAPFTVQGRLLSNFFNGQTPKDFQSQGLYIGNGDQDNYLKIALTANNGVGGLQVVYENAGVPLITNFPLLSGIPTSTLDLYLAVNPVSGTVQPKYSANGGPATPLGSPIRVGGALLAALQDGQSYAVGIIATCRGAVPFTATWDFVYVTADPVTATGAWQVVPPTAGAFTGREENAYVAAGDKFYLLGGRGIVPVQEYNPATKTWTDKAAPPIEMHHVQAVALDGLIYVVGAMSGGFPHEVPLASVYVFNPAANTWTVGAAIPQARRRGAGGCVVYQHKIYLVAGITDGHWAGWVPWMDEYDPTTNTWKTLPDAPRSRDHFHATVVNDKLYVVGGRRSSASTNQLFDLVIPEVDVYDFTTSKWTTLASSSNLPTPRAGAATVLLGNELLVIGGESAQATGHKDTHALDLSTSTWRRVADLQESTHGTQAIVNNGGIYIAAGAGNQGGSPLVGSQQAFYLYGPTPPSGVPIAQSTLAAPASLDYGLTILNAETTKTLTLTNTGGNQAILVSSLAISGSTAYTYTAPFTLPFVIPVGKSVDVTVKFKPATGGSQTASLVVAHSGQTGTTTTPLSGSGGAELSLYRVNAGGGVVTNTLGTFAADQYFSPAPGNVYSTTADISGTTEDAIYQSERYGSNFGYTFAASSGQQYKVVLHFAELYFTGPGQRVFDVAIEGNKVLDNYDITKKAGAFAATTETFMVTVADDALNINFSSLAADGGVDNAKISAIEILKVSSTGNPSPPPAPVANAGPDQVLTLPTSTTTLAGAGTAASGATITAYAWAQVGTTPAVVSFSSKAVANPSISGLTATGTYTLALLVTDNTGTTSTADQVLVTVNPAPASSTQQAVYRLNTGGEALSTTLGTFAADQYFAPAPGYTFSTTSAIANTANPVLYQTERGSPTNQGTFAYALPVANGTYTVVLHFAEIYWRNPGQRVFDVTLENVKVLDNYDVFVRAGNAAFTAKTETFTTTVSDGMLNLDFSALASDGGVDRPKVSAIEVLSSAAATNPLPVANAGPDKTITLPTNSVTLVGAGSDDGTIKTYAWAQASGPALATLSGATSPTLVANGLVAGTYVFSLVVTDNLNATSPADQVTVTVNPATPPPPAPVANAGPDQVLTLPTSTTTLAGAGTAASGATITAYAWAQVGTTPAVVSFSSKAVANPSISGLTATGTYTLALLVTDNTGTTSTADQVLVTVNPAPASSTQQLVSFTLVDVATNQPIRTLVANDVLNLALLPKSIAIRANTNPASVGSVAFILSGAATRTATDNNAPYALFGDANGKFKAWTPAPAPGTYTLKATPYMDAGAGGLAGTPLLLNFSVSKGAAAMVQTAVGIAAMDALEKPEAVASAEVFPNPSRTSRFSLRLPEAFQGEVSYLLISAVGASVSRGTLTVRGPNTYYPLNFSTQMVAEGVYYLLLSSNQAQARLKLIKSINGAQ